MMVISPYDISPARYDAWYDRNPAEYESELRAVHALIPPTGRGIEVGVGTGRFAGPTGIRTGLDPSAPMLAYAKRRGIDVMRGVAESFPAKEGTFDYALMVTADCFVNDLARTFAEIRRVLKPGGKLVIGFLDRDSVFGKRYLAERGDGYFFQRATFRSAREMEALLRFARFTGFEWLQTLARPLGEMQEPEPFREGHGVGAFAVVGAVK